MDKDNFFIADNEKREIFEKIIDRIKLQLKPKKIIIFGSIADGTFKKGSDIDIAVDTEIPISMLDCIGNFDVINIKKVDKKLKDEILKTGIVYYEEN